MIPQPAGLLTKIWHDLGQDYSYKFLTWDPDLSLEGNAKVAHLAHLIRTQPIVGAVVRHRCRTESGWHEGGIHFITELTEAGPFKEDTRWEVHSWDPLSITPSLISNCPCGSHGHIIDGRWKNA